MNFAQLRAIVWLRWRLTRNQFSRGSQVNAALSVLLVALVLMAGVGLGAAGLAVGVFLAVKASVPVLMVSWDAVIFFFLIFWLSGLLVEIQRSEVIDIPRLLHLPVTLGQVFLLNYAASHFTPVIVALVPGMLGLCLGLAIGAGSAMILLVPVVLGVLFATTAWTYCLRGWLAALMMVKRRRRAIVVWLTISIVGLSQLPNLLMNVRRHQPSETPPQASHLRFDRGLSESVVRAHLWVPYGWPGYAAAQLKEGRAVPSLAFTALALLLGAAGLARAYQLTVRFYRGASEPVSRSPAIAAGEKRRPASRGRLLVERSLPWLPDDTSALSLATFRSLTRAPELRMALVMPFVMFVGFAGVAYNRPAAKPLGEQFQGFAVSSVIVAVSFSLAPTMFNIFGLDRSGFRTLVLLPVQRQKVLLAKNLGFFPFAAGVTVLALLLAKWTLSLRWEGVLVGIVQVPTAFLLFSILCNFFSIFLPYRLSEGTLKAQKPRAVVFVAAFGAMLVTPVIMTPILLPPGLTLLSHSMGLTPLVPVAPLAALVALGAAIWAYSRLLPLQGKLLERREQAILHEVTAEMQ